METSTAYTMKPKLYLCQIETLFYNMFSDKTLVDEKGVVSTQYITSKEHANYVLWLTYNAITSNHNPSDKQIIWLLKSKFDIKSNVTVKCLKALDTLFDAVNTFTYNRNENCKRYNTANRDQTQILSWCKQLQDENPEVEFFKSRLKMK